MNKPLRILFTGTTGESIPPPYGGIPKRALMLGKIWREQGHDVGYTFTYHHKKEDDLGAKGTYFFEYSRLPDKIHKIAFIVTYFLKNPLLYLELCRKHRELYRIFSRERIMYAAYGVFIDGIISRFKPNVVVCEAALIRTFMAAHVAKRYGLPVVLETYAEVHHKEMLKLDDKPTDTREEFWKPFLALADIIIGPSHYCAKGPLAYAPKEKVPMVYATTLDVAKYDHIVTPEEKAELRKRFGIPKDAFAVMAVGAFTERKGHDHIIEAAAKLHAPHPDVCVILCGAGDPTKWREQAARLGVAGNVFIFQNLSEHDLILLYRTADTYCDASNTPRACLGIALTEGLASRLPTIAYDVAGLPESVVHEDNGYLVPLNNIDALAQAILRVHNLPADARRTLGERGFTRAQKIFDIHSIAGQLMDIFQDTVRKHRR